MKQHPIIFSTPMVKAILNRRKTQTRRICHHQHWQHHELVNFNQNQQHHSVDKDVKAPHGTIGDILWVRETWQHTSILNLNPQDENYGYVYKADGKPWEDYQGWKWKPSIYMPRQAARIFLKITKVWVERLHDITPSNAIDEGIDTEYDMYRPDEPLFYFYPTRGVKDIRDNCYISCNPLVSFYSLWCSINGKKSWDQNPWVFVYEFEKYV